MGRFEEIDHTADYALRVWGEDLRDLLETAGQGLIWLMTAGEAPAPSQWREYHLQAVDLEGLLVACLRELLALAEAGTLPAALQVREAGDRPPAAWLRVGVLPLPQARGYLHRHIKAVTYHNLALRPACGGLGVTITFDT